MLYARLREFDNYFILFSDLFIPGVLLQFCVWLRKRIKLFQWLDGSLYQC